MVRDLAPLVIAALVAGCGADDGGLVRIFIDTDAPVAGGEAFGAPPALFDRVRVDVFEPGANAPCVGCTRIVALDHASLAGDGLSFGIGLPAGASDARVRARAYRSDAFPDGDPSARASLEVVFRLPTFDEGETRDVTLFLPTDETGRPATSLDRPRKVASRQPKGERVGTWGPAQRLGCTGAARPGQVCIPGGAFWFPDPFTDQHSSAPHDEQLVVLSPFFVDATETTVRSLLRSNALVDPDALTAWSGDEEGAELGGFIDWCTFSGNVERLDLPVNCVTPRFARQYCQGRGEDLPTEAQLAYLMGGLASHRVPWGDERPRCDDAWVARVAFEAGTIITQSAQLECGDFAAFEPMRAVGTSGRDRIVLDTGTVEDLVGNAAELARDRFSTIATEPPCWADGWVVDPLCDPAALPDAPSVARGGAITSGLDDSGRVRAGVPQDAQAVDASFRCVRPGGDATPAPPELDVVIGQGCESDAGCGVPGARCIGPDSQWPAGGIVGGYCTRECDADAQCGPDSLCALGWCVRRCEAKKPTLEYIDQLLWPTKCLGRRDLACHQLGVAPEGACIGACTSDEACGGRYCDRKQGGCVDAKSKGAPDGAACSDDGDCQGFCVYGANGLAFCASQCSAGGEIDSDDCGGSANALCIAGEYQSVGSLGYCYSACTSHAACTKPNGFCVPVPSGGPTQEPLWWNVASAVCFEAKQCAAVGSSCGDPGFGLVCTDTAYGPYCLDPTIPWTD